jgi:CelD/BcsL family acetyltransferase involved in cellulose biosynthesis
VEAGWDDLLAAAGQRDPLRRSAVLALPDPAGDRAAVPRAVLVERGGRAVAAAALGVGRERGLVTVRHLGHAPNWFDPEPPAVDEEARAALVEALLSQPGDLLMLEELAEEGPLAGALADGSRPEIEVIPGPWTFRVRVADRRSHTARRRREARRLARRAADRGTPVVVRASGQWDRIRIHLHDLIDLQAESWEGREPDAFTGTFAGRRHVRRTIRALGAEGRARLVRVDVGPRLAAFHLAFVWGTRAVIYKTAFDRRLRGLPGLGWCSLLSILDLLAAEGVRWVDLGPGGDAYKAHIAEPEATLSVRAPLSPVGRVYMLAANARHAAGRRSRAGPPAPSGQEIPRAG